MADLQPRIADDTRPCRRGHAATFADASVGVFEEQRSSCFVLTGIAADIWQMCDGATTVREIVERLAARYPSVAPPTLERDLRSFLADSVGKGIVLLYPRLAEDVEVLLVEPPSSDPQHFGKSKEVSLGLSYLCAVLQTRGIVSRILDLRADPSPWRLLQETLEARRPRIVGITATSPAFRAAQFACFVARRTLPDALIALGGPHVTFLAAETLAAVPEADLVVRGEADETMVQVVDYYLAGRPWDDRLAGIAYRVRDRAVVTPIRPAPVDLDALPFPDPIRSTLFAPAYDELRIMGSRGCPFRCKFCSVSALSQGSLRRRSVRSVVDELEWKHRTYGARHFIFSDNLFVLNGRHERQICEEILARSLDITWTCNCRADLGDSALFALMYRSGCRRVFVGLESGDENVLRQMAKRLGPAALREGVRRIQSAGIAVSGGFILGLPGETAATFAETLSLARHLRCDDYGFTFFCPFPGTDIYDNLAGHRLRYTGGTDTFSVLRPVVDTEAFTQEDLIRAYITASRTLRAAPNQQERGDGEQHQHHRGSGAGSGRALPEDLPASV